MNTNLKLRAELADIAIMWVEVDPGPCTICEHEVGVGPTDLLRRILGDQRPQS